MFLASLVSAFALLAPSAPAATLTWSASGTNTAIGGTGQWDTTALRWTSNGTSWSAWDNGTGASDTAIFAGTAGTVTLTAPITANGLAFRTNNYVMTGGTLTLAGATPTITVNTNITGTIASSLAGTAGLTITGTGATQAFGTLVLSGMNTYSGTTTITGSSGIVRVLSSGALGGTADGTRVAGTGGTNVADLQVGSGVTVTGEDLVLDCSLGRSYLTLQGSATWAGNVAIVNGATQGNALWVTGAGNQVTGTISAAGNLIAGLSLRGTGTATASGPILIGSNVLSVLDGATWILTGTTTAGSISLNNTLTPANGLTTTLRIGGAGQLGTSGTFGAIQLRGYRFEYASSADQTITGAVAGTGGVVAVDGPGTLRLSGSNTYTGGTRLSAGTIVLGNASALGTGTVSFLANGPVARMGVSGTVANAVSVAAAAAVATIDTGVNAVTLSGVVSGSGGLTKTGAGSLALGASNTYTGTTAVQAGTLAVNGSLANTALVVDAGATLTGTGTIAGLTTIAGLHAPGNSPGVETFGNLGYSSGASVQWELWGNTESNSPLAFDQVVVNGDLAFNGPTTLDLVFTGSAGPTNFSTVAWSNAFWNAGREWLLYDVGGTTSGFGSLAVNTTNWQDSTGALLQTVRAGSTFSVEQRGNDVYVVYAVPEPGTLVLAASGLIIGVMAVRRRMRERRTAS